MSNNLSIVIIGGGLVGLMTALCLRRINHTVTIYERSSLSREIGAAISIAPDSGQILTSLGLDLPSLGCVELKGWETLNTATLDQLAPRRSIHGEKWYGAPTYSAHRFDVHSALLKEVLSKDGEGETVELKTSVAVVGYDADVGEVRLADGSVEKADLIIAADGVHSDAASYINGYPCPVQAVENVLVRFLIPTKVLKDDPVTKELVEVYGDCLRGYNSLTDSKTLVHYVCRGEELQNFALYVKTPVEERELESQKAKTVTREELKMAMEGFHPSLLRLCEYTDGLMLAWRVTERTPVERCTRGKMVMVGDAAHPMRPTFGMGYNSGVQDAAALQVSLEGVTKDDPGRLLERLRLFEKVRQPRVAATQLYSSKRVFDNPAALMKEEVRKLLGSEVRLPTNSTELTDWMMGYDVREEVRGALEESLSGINGSHGQ